MTTRHDRSGIYVTRVIPTNPEVEALLADSDIKYTRTSPTEITFKSNYTIAQAVKAIARHTKITRL